MLLIISYAFSYPVLKTLDHRIQFPCVKEKGWIASSLGKMQRVTAAVPQIQDWKQQWYDASATKTSWAGSAQVSNPPVCSLEHIYGVSPLSAPSIYLLSIILGALFASCAKMGSSVNTSPFFLKDSFTVCERQGNSDHFKQGRWFKAMCCYQNMS